MQDAPEVTFLVLMDAFVIALLVMLLNGCSARPVRFRTIRMAISSVTWPRPRMHARAARRRSAARRIARHFELRDAQGLEQVAAARRPWP